MGTNGPLDRATFPGPIRDPVMDQLSSRDVISFRNATHIKFSAAYARVHEHARTAEPIHVAARVRLRDRLGSDASGPAHVCD